MPDECLLGHAAEDDYEDDLLDVDPVPRRCNVDRQGPPSEDDDLLEVTSVTGNPGSVISDLIERVKPRRARN